MITVSFFIRGSKMQKTIQISCTFGGNQIRRSTGLKTTKSNWNSRKGESKDAETNQVLTGIRLAIEKNWTDYQMLNGEPLGVRQVQDNLAKLLKGYSKGKETTQQKLDRFLLEQKQEKAASTYNNYKSFVKKLKAFLAGRQWQPGMEEQFRNNASLYLVEDSVAILMSRLNVFLDFAGYKGRTHVVINGGEHIALQQKELDALWELTANPVRDMFLFGCLTAPRWGDLSRLTYEMVKDYEVDGKAVKYLDYTTQKTDEHIIAPLSEQAVSLLYRYGADRCFPKVSLTTFNVRIKELCQQAGIEQYSRVSSHTMRRTFITLAFEKGWTDGDIMIYSGHRSLDTLLKYRKKSVHHNLFTILRKNR